MHSYRLTHLKELESESIHILREVYAQFENPALLFSGGKDSIVCFHLARKAFFPSRVPFPLLHVDTGHNFEETIVFRDKLVLEHGAKLIVGSVQESIDQGKVTGGDRLLRQPQQAADGDAAGQHRGEQDRLRHRWWSAR
jgi:sulfate adenylyltransferase subunit 2